ERAFLQPLRFDERRSRWRGAQHDVGPPTYLLISLASADVDTRLGAGTRGECFAVRLVTRDDLHPGEIEYFLQSEDGGGARIANDAGPAGVLARQIFGCDHNRCRRPQPKGPVLVKHSERRGSPRVAQNDKASVLRLPSTAGSGLVNIITCHSNARDGKRPDDRS